MLCRKAELADRWAVGATCIGDDRRWRKALFPQEYAHQPDCGLRIPAGLNQNVQNFAFTVHSTPEIEPPPSNNDDHLARVPPFGRSWAPTSDPLRIGPTELHDPSSNCLIGDVETPLGEQVLDVPKPQRESTIEPNGMLDDDRWKAMTTVGYLAHPKSLKHQPRRSYAVNVIAPSAGLTQRSKPPHERPPFHQHPCANRFAG